MSFPRHPQAKFIVSAVKPSQFPTIVDKKGKVLPEVVVVGRSNVGKSSLLNHLFQSKNLVKTSATPGKTITLNFFSVTEEIAFVDLPGYGFAARPPTEKRKFQEMVEGYFRERASLALILFLFDVRREPKEEDVTLLRWLVDTKKPTLLVITKADKVGRTEEVRCEKQILKPFKEGGIEVPHILYSATKNRGRQELIGWINRGLS